jgi:hypothetical protein
MNLNELIMSHPHDHIMANTWRLIFEEKSPANAFQPAAQSAPDFLVLEQLLPEYRLIGLTLADPNKNRRHS